ncbi:hypothetical protein Q3G72_007371 [Acer saccharum]|nr:hypothetical protein Q3G72_007371 [Acer saccharum]
MYFWWAAHSGSRRARRKSEGAVAIEGHDVVRVAAVGDVVGVGFGFGHGKGVGDGGLLDILLTSIASLVADNHLLSPPEPRSKRRRRRRRRSSLVVARSKNPPVSSFHYQFIHCVVCRLLQETSGPPFANLCEAQAFFAEVDHMLTLE